MLGGWDVAIHPEPLVLHNFALASKMMNMEQFLGAAQERGVLARDGAEQWQRELKVADGDWGFTFAGMMFTVVGKKEESHDNDNRRLHENINR